VEYASLRGNKLWSEEDQLLLERYRAGLAVADAHEPEDGQGLDRALDESP